MLQAETHFDGELLSEDELSA